MGMLLLNGGMVASGLWNGAPQAPSVLQDRRIGAYMHSLWDHTSNPFANTPVWLERMANADGGKSVMARGQFGFNWLENADPPNFPNTSSNATSVPGALGSWPAVDAAGFTDVVVMADNFQGPPVTAAGSTDPSTAGTIPQAPNRLYPVELSLILQPWANNIGGTNVWLYSNWPEGRGFASDGTASDSSFATWRSVANGAAATWYRSLETLLQADPALSEHSINLIPVGEVLVSVMENTPASVMTAGDWFEDDAPHGQTSCYVVAGAIVYTAMFQEAAPEPSFTGATVHSSITGNWSTIASHIATQLGVT